MLGSGLCWGCVGVGVGLGWGWVGGGGGEGGSHFEVVIVVVVVNAFFPATSTPHYHASTALTELRRVPCSAPPSVLLRARARIQLLPCAPSFGGGCDKMFSPSVSAGRGRVGGPTPPVLPEQHHEHPRSVGGIGQDEVPQLCFLVLRYRVRGISVPYHRVLARGRRNHQPLR